MRRARIAWLLSLLFAVLAGTAVSVDLAAAQAGNRGRGSAWEDRDENRSRGRSSARDSERREDRDRDRDRDDDDWDDDDRWDDREIWGTDDRERGRERNGPAFCRSGAGHPVHGREWCRDRGYDQSVWETRRWEDSRYDGSYERRHADFHRDLDRRYEERMSGRGVTLVDQIQLRVEKIQEHDRWHDRAGVRH